MDLFGSLKHQLKPSVAEVGEVVLLSHFHSFSHDLLDGLSRGVRLLDLRVEALLKH